MLLRVFSSNRSLNLLLIFLIALILWLPSFLSSSALVQSDSDPMVLYSFLDGFMTRNVLLSKFLALLFLIFQSYMLVIISGKFILLQGRSYFPALFFLLIASFYPGMQQFSQALVGSLFVIISINLFFQAYNKESISYRFFDAGLVLGLGSLFYAKLILFLPILWIAAIILRKAFWGELIMPVLGIAIPPFMVAGIDFLRGENPWQVFISMKEHILNPELALHTDFGFWLIVGVLFLSLLISSVYMLNIFQFRKIFIRNYFLVLFWIFVLGLSIFIFFASFDMGIVYIIAIPVAFIMSNYFFNMRKTLGNRLLFGLIILSFVFNGVNQVFGWL